MAFNQLNRSRNQPRQRVFIETKYAVSPKLKSNLNNQSFKSNSELPKNTSQDQNTYQINAKALLKTNNINQTKYFIRQPHETLYLGQKGSQNKEGTSRRGHKTKRKKGEQGVQGKQQGQRNGKDKKQRQKSSFFLMRTLYKNKVQIDNQMQKDKQKAIKFKNTPQDSVFVATRQLPRQNNQIDLREKLILPTIQVKQSPRQSKSRDITQTNLYPSARSSNNQQQKEKFFQNYLVKPEPPNGMEQRIEGIIKQNKKSLEKLINLKKLIFQTNDLDMKNDLITIKQKLKSNFFDNKSEIMCEVPNQFRLPQKKLLYQLEGNRQQYNKLAVNQLKSSNKTQKGKNSRSMEDKLKKLRKICSQLEETKNIYGKKYERDTENIVLLKRASQPELVKVQKAERQVNEFQSAIIDSILKEPNSKNINKLEIYSNQFQQPENLKDTSSKIKTTDYPQ